jgi:hypothetical protein
LADPFRWKNCYADVLSSGYRQVAQAFLSDVVEPALAALDAKIRALKESEDDFAPFIESHVQDVLRASTMAFCLSIQSMWEQQIRAYLKRCARELTGDPAQAARVSSARWEDLDGIFTSLRGIALKDFLEYPDLDLLQLVGNVCRHGDGTSLEKLAKSHPEFWPPPVSPPVIIDGVIIAPAPRTVDTLQIPRALLSRFVGAIVSFWDETEYIYNESIETKHPSLEKTLVEQRLKRAKRRALRGVGGFDE